MSEFVITEDELKTLMIIWKIPTPSGYISKKMSNIEKNIRKREIKK